MKGPGSSSAVLARGAASKGTRHVEFVERCVVLRDRVAADIVWNG
jgi:hypothetical protein